MNDEQFRQRIRRALDPMLAPGASPNLRSQVRERVQNGRKGRPLGTMAVTAVTAVALAAVMGTAVAMRSHGGGSTGPQSGLPGAAASSPSAGIASPTATATAAAPTATAPATAAAAPTPRPTSRPSPTPSPTPLPNCAASDVSVKVDTDAPTYAPGQPVTVTTSVTNTSKTTCNGSGVQPNFQILDSSGKEVFACRVPLVEAGIGSQPSPWSPGQSISGDCQWRPSPPAAAGSYTAKVLWYMVTGLSPTSKSFTIQ